MGSREGLVTATPFVLGSPSSSRVLPSRRPTGPGHLAEEQEAHGSAYPRAFILPTPSPPPGSVACPRVGRIVQRCH